MLTRDYTGQNQSKKLIGSDQDTTNIIGSNVFDKIRLEEFWHFVMERQRIWEARYIKHEPPPWTLDEVLNSNHFTNIYRELDPGTKYAVKHILESNEPPSDRFFNLMIYRLIGKEETHKEVGFQHLKSYSQDRFESKLRDIRKNGHSLFTSAYMVSAYHCMGSSDKIANVSRLFALLCSRFEAFFERLMDATTMEGAYSILKEQVGYGNFLSYQILVDATYPLKKEKGLGLLKVNPNDWAAAGPGAKRGISLLLSDKHVSELSVMKWLRDNQKSEMIRLNLDFPYLVGPSKRRIEISLSNIQNCLCEYYKYTKIKEGWGRGRRTFNPFLRDNLQTVDSH